MGSKRSKGVHIRACLLLMLRVCISHEYSATAVSMPLQCVKGILHTIDLDFIPFPLQLFDDVLNTKREYLPLYVVITGYDGEECAYYSAESGCISREW